MSQLHQTWKSLRHRWMTTLDQPEVVAARALGFMRTKPSELARLASLSGLSASALGRHPPSPEQLAVVLAFLLDDEVMLNAFTGETELPVEATREARRQLVRSGAAAR